MPRPDPHLTPRDRVVLLSLMAVATDVSNRELKARCGLDLTGDARHRLNDAGLVNSPKVGRELRHELTEDGWDWAKKEFSQPYPPRADTGTRGMYLILSRFSEFLDRTNQSADAIFTPPAKDLGIRLRKAVTELAEAPGEWVALSQLRLHLSDVPRKELDAALSAAYQQKDLVIMADADERRLSAADRAAAVRIGGEDHHLIRLATS
ncbi:hypothetical protein GCM10022223_43080 [Kineosporia mesophila]|uniref:MarR family transcriptional regulator n=2 Tax=Kineosporia mesophila TaxID=566012 RepID=A0ABP6ZY58_9ACTN